jgi:hypothetical protein
MNTVTCVTLYEDKCCFCFPGHPLLTEIFPIEVVDITIKESSANYLCMRYKITKESPWTTITYSGPYLIVGS